MERELVLSDPSDVTDALLSSSLVPPPPPPAIGGGSTARLRGAMARFGSGSDHAHRRRSVEAAVHLIGSFPFEQAAFERTVGRLGASRIDVVRDIGFVVPCEIVGSALGVPEPLLPGVLPAVRALTSARYAVVDDEVHCSGQGRTAMVASISSANPAGSDG